MSLVKWQPFLDVFDEVDDFFGNVPRQAIAKSFTPAVNISQTDTEVKVEVPLPGIDANKVDVTVENDVLTIQGKEEKKNEIDEKNYTRREWVCRSFHRSVALPVSVKPDKAEAEYQDGVLKINIPKREEAKARKISVKVKK